MDLEPVEYYHNKYFTERKNNMKMLWTGICSIMNVKNARLNNISQIIQAGKTINDPGKIAKSFFIVNVASNLNNEIPRTQKFPLDYLDHRINVTPIDEIEVKDIISQMQTGKSVGPFSISINLLKMLSSVIASPLVIPVNE